MSQELPKNNDNKSEEVDLLVFFNLIGNAFGKVYSFFERIFKTIYKLIIALLLHLFKSAKWYAIGIIVSFAIGYGLDSLKEKNYGANMFINTNFNSTRQVYENMRNLNQLAAIDHDSKEIARQLKISEEEASKIKNFYIEPDIDQNTQMEMYVAYRSGLDSVSRVESTFKDYLEGLNSYSFKSHKIGVLATDKNVYKSLKNNFVSFLRKNPYLDSLKQINSVNINAKIKDITGQIQKLDSLKNSYLAIRIKESDKSVSDNGGSGTNFYMGNSQPNELLVDESNLTTLLFNLTQQKTNLENNLDLNRNIIDVVSDFPPSGYDVSQWTDYFKFTFPIIAFILIFLVIMFINLSRFLKSQS
ncbi:hypothetical protein [Olleya namhaensis]|uniref:Chain length determinant protein n=1 Tax=Olleya namhaensis TaxID=1144750 RepID=A0A1I3JNN6_9FLAO|nr:hypothetical protein [Olleya namhaensis]SFI61515.1 hypothetical protein SAMN05443431_101472 [Olleya namhaensis]